MSGKKLHKSIPTYACIYIPSSSIIVTAVISQSSVLLGCEGYLAEMINDLSLVSNIESSYVEIVYEKVVCPGLNLKDLRGDP